MFVLVAVLPSMYCGQLVLFVVSQIKLLKYPGLQASSFANTYVIGKSLNIIRAYNFLGVNVENGLPEYEDVNKDGMISAPEDYTIVGKTSPLAYGGFGSDFNYKNFQLNIFLQFSRQYAQGLVNIPGLRSNKFDVAITRWQKPGDVTTTPKAVGIPSPEYFNLAQSDAAFYNASYLRLKNISFSYQLPSALLKRLSLSNCKLFIEGQNLVTWRKKGSFYDPETATLGIGPLKSLVAGIHLTL